MKKTTKKVKSYKRTIKLSTKVRAGDAWMTPQGVATAIRLSKLGTAVDMLRAYR